MNAVPMQIDGIDHLVLRVMNLEKSLEFYVGILGLHAERIVEGAGFCQVRCGRCMIDLMAISEGSRLPDPGQGNVDHMCLNVRGDVDQIVAYLTERQVKMRGAPGETYGATGFGTSIYIFDPDHHMIELKTHYAQYPVRVTVEEALNSSRRSRSSG